ncbi:MAG: hypothetical protein GY701_07065 [Sulfitobacter sp.]|nr:hypothetical protein [Sulfitobacter sp.]
MTTVGQMVDRVLNRMGARDRMEYDVLTTTLDTSETGVVLDLDHAGSKKHGAVIEIGTEQMLVLAYVDPTYTVVRGHNGSTKAAHTAGDLVLVEPRFPRSTMIQLLEEEIHSWPDTVGQVTSTELTFSAMSPVVDSGLGTGVDLRRFLGLKTEPHDAYDQWRNLDFGYIRDANESDFTSGYGIQPPQPLGFATTVHLHALIGFTLTDISVEATDLTSAVGVSPGLEEALLYGMIMRAMSGKEIPRTDELHAQQNQRNERVPPTHLAQTAEIYSRLRDRAIAAEVRRINAEFPYQKSSAG